MFTLHKIFDRLAGRYPQRKRFPLQSPITPDPEPSHALTITAIVKNEAPYLAEWIAFHAAAGATRFLIYDNGNTDDSAAVLQPFIAAGLVELIPWPHFAAGMHTQALAYAHALSYAGAATRWMAFIDLDEFLFDPEGHSLPERLQDYADLPALCVFRHHFGTSGHLYPPGGFVIDAFTRRHEPEPGPQHLSGFMVPKAIVQPARVLGSNGAHRPILPDKTLWGYDEKRRPVRRDNSARFSADKLCINHYYTKNEETFLQRTRRRTTAANQVLRPDEYDRGYRTLALGIAVDRRIARWSGPAHEMLRRLSPPPWSLRMQAGE